MQSLVTVTHSCCNFHHVFELNLARHVGAFAVSGSLYPAFESVLSAYPMVIVIEAKEDGLERKAEF